MHQGDYIRTFYSAPYMRPPMCLQYAIWCMAAQGHQEYGAYYEAFYLRARRYLEADELKECGEHFISIQHTQAWCLVATAEARSMSFTRASMSCARAVRLVMMLGLHRLDDPLSDDNPISSTLPPPASWVELEERRRTFWEAFCIDSHASITTGWPSLIDYNDITTHLPASEEAFHTGNKEETTTLQDVFSGTPYSAFAGAVVVCYIFNLMGKHVQRLKANDHPESYEYGEYWKRHRELDNTLSTAFIFIPERFRLPKHMRNPVSVHRNLNLHASVITLHIAAYDMADKHNLPDHVKQSSQTRMLAAANEIVHIMKMTSHYNGPVSISQLRSQLQFSIHTLSFPTNLFSHSSNSAVPSSHYRSTRLPRCLSSWLRERKTRRQRLM